MLSGGWTDELAEPLAAFARDGDWDRVEEAKHGGWLLLTRNGRDRDTRWFHATAECVEPIEPLSDPRLRQLPLVVSRWLAAGYSVGLLAWRVGSRAIFRLETDDGPRIAKLYRRDKQYLQRWRALPASASQWRVPRILDWDPEQKVLTLELCAGESLNRRWLDDRGEVADGDRVGDVLEWLEGTPVPEGFPVHTVEDEVRLLEERLDVFERTLRHPPALAGSLTRRVIDGLQSAPDVQGVFCHRDFHDKQLLCEGRGGTLLDLDLAACGHPGLDVGNILAHLRLRALNGARMPWRRMAHRIVARSATSREIEGSLHLWTAATLMRLSLIYARRRRPADLIAQLLASTEDALARGGEWGGILPEGSK